VVVGTELTEPRGELTGRIVLEQLMDTAPAQPSCCGDLAAGQSSLVGGHNRPDPFLLCVGQPGSRQAQPCCELLVTLDALVELRAGLHGLENTWVFILCLDLAR
jgi:hypothetical protein